MLDRAIYTSKYTSEIYIMKSFTTNTLKTIFMIHLLHVFLILKTYLKWLNTKYCYYLFHDGGRYHIDGLRHERVKFKITNIDDINCRSSYSFLILSLLQKLIVFCLFHSLILPVSQ